MALKLYQFDSCPFCARVRKALEQDYPHLEVELVHIDPWDRSEVEQVSGQAQVPVLVDTERGETIPDSSRILAYLQEHYAA